MTQTEGEKSTTTPKVHFTKKHPITHSVVNLQVKTVTQVFFFIIRVRRLSDRGSVCIYCRYLCIFLFTTRGQQLLSYTVKMFSRPSHSTHISEPIRTQETLELLSDWLVSVTHLMTADDGCFCLSWTISVQNVSNVNSFLKQIYKVNFSDFLLSFRK